MFESPTTIIVGAGASLDFGLPSGTQLWLDVRHLLQSIYLAVMPPASSHIEAAPLRPVRLISPDSPYVRAMLQTVGLDRRAARQSLYKLVQTVQESDVHASVDDFLRDHPGVRREIKTAIAAVLFDKLYDESESWWVRSERLLQSNLDGPAGTTINWCRRFVGVCRPLLQKVHRLQKVTIVNFNYDRVFETVLQHYWGRTEREYPRFDECFEFFYPYGAFDELPISLKDPAPWICDQSTKLGLADGESEGGDPVEEIRRRLDRSKTIFSVGFSCGRTNQTLLGLGTQHSLKIIYQNYENSDARLNRTMSALGVIEKSRETGSMADLLSRGFFERSAPED